MFCKKVALRNFAKFTGKYLCKRLFFKDVAGLSPAILLKNSLWHRCFLVNFAKFLRTPFFREHLRWLLLLFDRTLDMAYELNRRKNVCIFGNVIALYIILRNEILGNNGLFKVRSTYNIVAYSEAWNTQSI